MSFAFLKVFLKEKYENESEAQIIMLISSFIIIFIGYGITIYYRDIYLILFLPVLQILLLLFLRKQKNLLEQIYNVSSTLLHISILSLIAIYIYLIVGYTFQ